MIRLCLEPGCPNEATYRGRCQAHSRQRERSIDRAGKRVYNSKRWKMTRRAKLNQSPICEYVDPDEGPCQQIATDVHHKHGVKTSPWAMEGLESLCHSHHSQVTRGEQLVNDGFTDNARVLSRLMGEGEGGQA